jgi:hypothetical protein
VVKCCSVQIDVKKTWRAKGLNLEPHKTNPNHLPLQWFNKCNALWCSLLVVVKCCSVQNKTKKVGEAKESNLAPYCTSQTYLPSNTQVKLLYIGFVSISSDQVLLCTNSKLEKILCDMVSNLRTH